MFCKVDCKNSNLYGNKFNCSVCIQKIWSLALQAAIVGHVCSKQFILLLLSLFLNAAWAIVPALKPFICRNRIFHIANMYIVKLISFFKFAPTLHKTINEFGMDEKLLLYSLIFFAFLKSLFYWIRSSSLFWAGFLLFDGSYEITFLSLRSSNLDSFIDDYPH